MASSILYALFPSRPLLSSILLFSDIFFFSTSLSSLLVSLTLGSQDYNKLSNTPQSYLPIHVINKSPPRDKAVACTSRTPPNPYLSSFSLPLFQSQPRIKALRRNRSSR
ncbi:hypothetical protein J3F83DRAFT_753465 [Trichoderma novae-zelandiae]